MSSTAVDITGLRTKMVCKSSGALWIFGYGSLIWKPGFAYKKRVVGFLSGYIRRFYQGTTTHRGTAEWPGRVATIEASPSDNVWGVAYQVEGPEAIDGALKHLAEREMITGGYHFERVQFTSSTGEIFYIQVYIADAVNNQYLGDAPIHFQAYQIFRAHGVCGSNVEYVRKVVDFMINEVPGGLQMDPYLATLDDCLHEFELREMTLSQNELAQLPIQVRAVEGDDEYAQEKIREHAKEHHPHYQHHSCNPSFAPQSSMASSTFLPIITSCHEKNE